MGSTRPKNPKTPKPRHWTDDELELALSEWNLGVTWATIAEIHHAKSAEAAMMRVRAYVARTGKEIRFGNGENNQARRKLTADLLDRGYSTTEAARLAGWSNPGSAWMGAKRYRDEKARRRAYRDTGMKAPSIPRSGDGKLGNSSP